jgi:diguanylate cyclase (GGDEF)-like protein
MNANRVLVIDTNKKRRKRLTTQLQSLHYQVVQTPSIEHALQSFENHEPDVIVCDSRVAKHSLSKFFDYVKEFLSGHIPVVLTVGEKEEAPERIRDKFGATSVIRYPIVPHKLDNIAHLLSVSRLKQRLDHLQAENRQLRKAGDTKSWIDPVTRFYRFDVFKKMIALEAKRAKRYGYPLSILLLAYDNLHRLCEWLDPKQRQTLYTQCRKNISASVRDVDMPLLFAKEKVLVMMSNTSITGAAIVADRVRDRIRCIKPPGSRTDLRLSVSISVASTEGDRDRSSFGVLVQKAIQALKEAEGKGGDAVLICSPENVRGKSQLGPRTFFI